MTDAVITAHKAKHLLSHVLVVAAVRRWPGVALGESGETATGFYADFGLVRVPGAGELSALTDDMARVLRNFRTFRDVKLTPTEALRAFHGQPWKLKQVAAIAELEARIVCYELDGFIDICECAIKEPRELRALHPEKFLLTEAHPVAWSDRGSLHPYARISGELFPAPPPCECCSP
ncbi:MAG: hypothetical protein FJ382_09885 [Verrucomicrobia bacterium]|nr:hypothetical protein [Verrucomicrobiota bacterium]